MLDDLEENLKAKVAGKMHLSKGADISFRIQF